MIHQTLTDSVESNVSDYTACTDDITRDRITSFGKSATTRRKRSSSHSNNTMISTIFSLLLLSALVQAQDTQFDSELCSCSPREYYFKLDLSATCPDLPPPFPPNDVFGAGVKDYTCTIGPEPVPDKKSVGNKPRSVPFSQEDVRQLVDGTTREMDDFDIPQIIDPEPVVIDSIQFFEVDPDFNVINQDPSYVRDVKFVDGDIFNYTSISDLVPTSRSETNLVPGGINMVLRGYNAAGERVRNVFTITFTNECGVPTFDVDDEIGWVIFDSFTPASDETCRTVPRTDFPTPSPESYAYIANKPTSSTDSKPGVMSMDLNMFYSESKSSKSKDAGRGSKSSKSKNAGRSSKSSKSKSVGKSGKSSNMKKNSKRLKEEPIRNLRATVDQMDLDRGSKPSIQ